MGQLIVYLSFNEIKNAMRLQNTLSFTMVSVDFILHIATIHAKYKVDILSMLFLFLCYYDLVILTLISPAFLLKIEKLISPMLNERELLFISNGDALW